MSEIRIIATAGDQLISDEVMTAVKQVLGSQADILARKISDLSAGDEADLYICVSSRKGEVEKKVPSEKVLGIELAPENRFYIDLAKIHSGETVHVFNNSTGYAKTLVRYCTEIGIDHLRFELIPYDELPEAEVISRLKQAKYIIGVETIIGSGGVFSQRFKQYAPAGVQVYGAKRVTSVNSACEIMKWITLFSQAKLAQNVSGLTSQLTQQLQQITTATQRVSSTFEQGTAAYAKLEAKMTQGLERLEQVKQLADDLFDAAKSIGNIADTINHISTQTNLLALNATIEAARVGEAGRGFAVVAKEVGKLAAESQKSTETIRKAIAHIQSAVGQIAPAVSSLSSEMSENQNYFAQITRSTQDENQSIMGIFKALENIQSMSEKLVAATNKL